MKVLIVSRYCAHPSWHGSAKHAQSFASALLAAGHSVALVTGEDVAAVEKAVQDGYSIYKVPLVRSSGKLESYLSAAHRDNKLYDIALSILTTESPDVVHFGAIGKLGAFVEAAHALGIPSVALVHDFFWVCLKRFAIREGKACSGPETLAKCQDCLIGDLSAKRRLLTRLFAAVPSRVRNRLDSTALGHRLNARERTEAAISYLASIRSMITCFVVQNRDSRLMFSASGVSADRIRFVPQALVASKLTRYPRQPRSSPLPIRIGYVGRISREKGLDVLFDALGLLRDQSKVSLTIVCHGVTLGTLRAHVDSFPGSLAVELLGTVRRDQEVAQAIARFDVSVIPSKCWEVGPRTLTECIAQGVPCVASSTVGNRYLIEDGVNGKVFREGDAAHLASILEEIIRQPAILDRWRAALPVIPAEEERTKLLLEVHRRAIADAAPGRKSTTN